MIIKVKTNGRKLDELSKYLLSESKSTDKNSYQISSDRLNYVLDYLKGKGIIKIKLVMESSDNFIKESHNELSIKPSQMEYFEFILRYNIEVLQLTKDLDTFFENINFSDENDCYKKLYNKICSISKAKEEIWLSEYKVNRNGFYYLACCELCSNEDEAKKLQEDLKKSLKEWLNIYFPDYIKYFPNGLPYTAFVRFLLKATGRKYY